MILDEWNKSTSEIESIINSDCKIQKFCVTSNGLFILFVNDKGTIQLVSVPDKCIVPKLFYQIPEGEKRILGMELDFKNNLWVSTSLNLYIINEEFELVKTFSVEKNKSLNTISIPDEFTSNLCISFDKMKILWYKSNYELV